MDKALGFLANELGNVRSGRASTGLVDSLKVDYYNVPTPLKSLAQIHTPDAKTIMISPYDKTTIPMIEKAIRESRSLGLNPQNDGNNVILNVPPLTEERRRDMLKMVSDKVEETNIALRNIRHEALEEVKKLEKSKELTEDERYKAEEEMNKLIESYKKKAIEMESAKNTEMMEV